MPRIESFVDGGRLAGLVDGTHVFGLVLTRGVEADLVQHASQATGAVSGAAAGGAAAAGFPRARLRADHVAGTAAACRLVLVRVWGGRLKRRAVESGDVRTTPPSGGVARGT